MKLLSKVSRFFLPWKGRNNDETSPTNGGQRNTNSQSNPRIKKEIARRRLAAQQIEYVMRLAAIREENILRTSPNAAEILNLAYSNVSRRIGSLPQSLLSDVFLQSSGWIEAIEFQNDDPGILKDLGQIKQSLILEDGREVTLSRQLTKNEGQNDFYLVHELKESNEKLILPDELPFELFPLYTSGAFGNRDVNIVSGPLLSDILHFHGFSVAGILTAPIHLPEKDTLRTLLEAESITIWAVNDDNTNTFMGRVAERLYELGVTNLRIIQQGNMFKNHTIQDFVESPQLVAELKEGAAEYSYEERSGAKVAVLFDPAPDLTTRLLLEPDLLPPMPALIPTPRRTTPNENPDMGELKAVLEKIVKTEKLTAEQMKSLKKWVAGNS